MMRWMRKAHNYLGLILFIQIGLWFLSGLVMAWLPIEEVRGNHLKHNVTMSWHGATVSPSDVLDNHSNSATFSLTHRIFLEPLSSVLSAIPVYEVVDSDTSYHYSALTGEELHPLEHHTVRNVAQHQYVGEAHVVSAQLLNSLPQEVQNLTAPLWQVSFDDEFNTRFYIEPDTGAVARVRTDTWRLFDFMWMLHIMDYKNRSDFNSPWLIAFSASAFLFTLTGVVLLYQRFKPKRRKR